MFKFNLTPHTGETQRFLSIPKIVKGMSNVFTIFLFGRLLDMFTSVFVMFFCLDFSSVG